MKPRKTDAEKKKAQIAKMKASLVLHRASAFNVALAPRELVKAQKFNSGIFRSNQEKTMNTKTINPLDKHLDAILRAGGSALKYYSEIGQSRDNMRAVLSAAVAELAPASGAPALPLPILQALRFYAHGDHFDIDGDCQDFDTVSGEPENWQMSQKDDDCTMFEDGTVARMALQGRLVWNFDDADDEPKPVDGEVFDVATPPAVVSTAPTSELSDEQIKEMWRNAQDSGLTVVGAPSVRFARAVIAADQALRQSKS